LKVIIDDSHQSSTYYSRGVITLRTYYNDPSWVWAGKADFNVGQTQGKYYQSIRVIVTRNASLGMVTFDVWSYTRPWNRVRAKLLEGSISVFPDIYDNRVTVTWGNNNTSSTAPTNSVSIPSYIMQDIQNRGDDALVAQQVYVPVGTNNSTFLGVNRVALTGFINLTATQWNVIQADLTPAIYALTVDFSDTTQFPTALTGKPDSGTSATVELWAPFSTFICIRWTTLDATTATDRGNVFQGVWRYDGSVGVWGGWKKLNN
jgi:hypothetical protein